MNSVGLKSGFFASLTALVLSSTFLEMVDLMVLAAGISMPLGAGLLSVILGLVWVEEVVELEDDDEVEVEEDKEEQVLQSESESLGFALCPGMFPLVMSVSV